MDIFQKEQMREAHEAESLRRRLLAAADFKAITETAAGRRFLRRLLAECGLMQAALYLHKDRPIDALEMAYHEGRRYIGRWLIGLFQDQPERYLQLLREQMDDEHV
ncbi:hypothetical protein [Methylomonas sp. AM2-LC]|uniref:Bbp19 family protein n=1 Tax=Methylomonas sp. AM2-LC TaxID=3153301 RepID=UPI00326670F9